METIEERTQRRIDEIVAAAPPLDGGQRSRLRLLLLGTSAGAQFEPSRPCDPPTAPPAIRSVREDESTWLYRHFDEAGTLLYVGISYDDREPRRQVEHGMRSTWAQLSTRKTEEFHATRAQAAAAELAAIETERPVFNRRGAEATWRESVVTYLVALGRHDLIARMLV